METLTREQIKQQVALMVNACSIDCQPEACLCQQIENAALSYIDDAMEFAMMFATPKQFGTADVERNGYAEWKLLGIDRRKPELILPDGAKSPLGQIDHNKLPMREAEKPTAKAGNSVASKESGLPSDFPHRTPGKP